jgi:hypothetical protein
MTINHQPIDISVISVTLHYSPGHQNLWTPLSSVPNYSSFLQIITFHQHASKPSCTQDHVCIPKNYHNICSRILYFPSHMYRHRQKNDQSIYSHVDKHTFWNVGYELYIHTADCLKRLPCGYMKSSQQWHEERKPTRCYTMVYWTYDSPNMFRALLCPSSGAWDYTHDHSMWHITLVIAGHWAGAWL